MKLRERFGAIVLALACACWPALVAGGSLLAWTAASSCVALDRRIDSDTIAGPLQRVLARTAAYLAADESLAPERRAELESSIEQLAELLERPRIDPGALEAAGLERVAAEHDARVGADPALSDLERRIYHGDSEAVVDVAAAARSPE